MQAEAQPSLMEATTNLVIITDPGPDPDDVKALCVAATMHRMRNSGLRLRAVITNGGGDALGRARLARCVLDHLSVVDVPVGAGSDGTPRTPAAFEYDIPGYEDVDDADIEDGARLLRTTLEDADPGSVTLVLISALTDFAAATRDYPAIVIEKVARVCIMGGLVADASAPHGYAIDSSANNQFDVEAATEAYNFCFDQGVPMTVVNRHGVPALPMHLAKFFADRSLSPVPRYLARAQDKGLLALWRKLCAGELPSRCTKEWFFQTFCGVDALTFRTKGLEALDADADIVQHLQGFVNPYDVVALMAVLPERERLFPDLAAAEVRVPAPARGGRLVAHVLILDAAQGPRMGAVIGVLSDALATACQSNRGSNRESFRKRGGIDGGGGDDLGNTGSSSGSLGSSGHGRRDGSECWSPGRGGEGQACSEGSGGGAHPSAAGPSPLLHPSLDQILRFASLPEVQAEPMHSLRDDRIVSPLLHQLREGDGSPAGSGRKSGRASWSSADSRAAQGGAGSLRSRSASLASQCSSTAAVAVAASVSRVTPLDVTALGRCVGAEDVGDGHDLSPEEPGSVEAAAGAQVPTPLGPSARTSHRTSICGDPDRPSVRTSHRTSVCSEAGSLSSRAWSAQRRRSSAQSSVGGGASVTSGGGGGGGGGGGLRDAWADEDGGGASTWRDDSGAVSPSSGVPGCGRATGRGAGTFPAGRGIQNRRVSLESRDKGASTPLAWCISQARTWRSLPNLASHYGVPLLAAKPPPAGPAERGRGTPRHRRCSNTSSPSSDQAGRRRPRPSIVIVSPVGVDAAPDGDGTGDDDADTADETAAALRAATRAAAPG